MIKLYDPNEKKETELRICIEQNEIDNEIDLMIVDLDGNHIETFASITEGGIEFFKVVNPENIPFKLTAKNYIAAKYN